jgi:hypothetical protein
MAGVKRLELPTFGFGGRCTTIVLHPCIRLMLRRAPSSGKSGNMHTQRSTQKLTTSGSFSRRTTAPGLGIIPYSMISVTTPAPTVRPPSRMAKRSSLSMAMGVISSASMVTLSPGITISTPSGSFTMPVTSVVRK